ncbi:MAG: glycosyltransferase [Pseudomonadota bacterium]
MSGVVFVVYDSTPLHRARLQVLNRTLPVQVVEVVRRSQHYNWGGWFEKLDYPLHVLFEKQAGEDEEDAAVSAVLKRLQPEIVFVPGYGRRFARTVTDYALRTGTSSVLISDSTAREGRSDRRAEMIKRWMVGAHHAAFVAGTPQARQVAHLGMAESRIFTGYDVVDNRRIAAQADAARAALDEIENAPVSEPAPFLCVSRLVWQKNLDTLIDAFAIFARRAPYSRRVLHIVGYGPLQEVLQARIDAAGMTARIRLLGGVDYREMPRHYAKAAAFVLASSSEPWGLVVNEAMAAGLPVAISAAVGCAEDLVQEGRNGFVFEPEDVAAIADALVALDMDAEARAAMGRASREIIASWTLQRFADGAAAAASAAKAMCLPGAARLRGRAAIALLRRRRDRVRGFEGRKS